MQHESFFVGVGGGPCAGKTSFMSVAPQKLWEMGVRTFTPPEAATLIIHPGVPDLEDIELQNRGLYVQLEKEMVALYLSHYKRFKRIMNYFPGKKVCLFDRFANEAAAYLESHEYDQIIGGLGLKQESLLAMCAGCIFLRTAAYGAEEFYTRANNPARKEKTLKEARAVDDRTYDAWKQHPNIHIIDNSTDFEGKIDRALQALFQIIGVPVPLYHQRKFLLDRMPDFGCKIQRVTIEQVYLTSDVENCEVRIRRWGTDGFFMHVRSLRAHLPNNKIIKTQHIISPQAYRASALCQDSNTRIIRKTRYCFLHNHRYVKLDHFHEPVDLYILEIDPTQEYEKIEIPAFVKGRVVEVTGDMRFSNYQIARIGWRNPYARCA